MAQVQIQQLNHVYNTTLIKFSDLNCFYEI